MTIQTEPIETKLKTPADLIGSIPLSLGFHPSESLVVVTVHGPRHRAGLTLRCDLPPTDDHGELADYVVEAVVRQNPTTVVLVCFSEAPDDGGLLPHHGLISYATAKLGENDIDCQAALLARDNSWWFYGVGDDSQSPTGTPLPETPSQELTALAARRALDGRAVAPSREALAASVDGPVAVQLAVMERACDNAMTKFVDELRHDEAERAAAHTLRLTAEARDAHRNGNTPSPEVTARILAGLHTKQTRDALLTWGLDDDANELVHFLTCMATLAPDDYAAPVCTALAGIAYVNYNCATATVALERALRCDPSYYMAQLLHEGLTNQVPPTEWHQVLTNTRHDLELLGFPVTGRASP